jgi:pyruvate/2-oxoglutarate dehydrogenase complex dihydrolipoamide dehydrogenase (E3) component
VIQQQVDTHTRFYDRNKIGVFHGRAYIQDKNTVLVFSHEGIKETIICKQIVIATGSRPYHPQGLILTILAYLIRTKSLILIIQFKKSLFMARVLLAVNMPQFLLV